MKMIDMCTGKSARLENQTKSLESYGHSSETITPNQLPSQLQKGLWSICGRIIRHHRGTHMILQTPVEFIQSRDFQSLRLPSTRGHVSADTPILFLNQL